MLLFFQLNKKIEKSTNELSKLNSQRTPAEQDVDKEMMTEEEKECLRTIGLKMHSCLVLGKEKLSSLININSSNPVIFILHTFIIFSVIFI